MASSSTYEAAELSRQVHSTRGLRIATIALALGALSFAALLFGIRSPSTMYYDEGYFVPEARALVTGTPNPHPYVSPFVRPPFGKFVIAAGMKIAGDNPVGWRLPSAAAGALTVVAVYLWTCLLIGDSGLALVAAGLTFFDNFLFVMSRIAMMDAFFVCFLTWSVVAYTASLTLDLRPWIRRLLFVSAGITIGLAAACKWNAVDTLAVLLLFSFGIPLLARRSPDDAGYTRDQSSKGLSQIGLPTMLASLVAAPVISYILTWVPLFRSLHKPFDLRALWAMNEFIWRFSTTETSNRAITSAWYSWPLGWPVDLERQRALSYLAGNPVIAWAGLVALGVCIWRLSKGFALPEAIVALLFAANLLQWAVTPEKGLFYYYYYPCFIFLGVAIALALRYLPRTVFGIRLSLVLVVAAAVIFLWCLPQMAHLQAPWDCVWGCWS